MHGIGFVLGVFYIWTDTGRVGINWDVAEVSVLAEQTDYLSTVQQSFHYLYYIHYVQHIMICMHCINVLLNGNNDCLQLK